MGHHAPVVAPAKIQKSQIKLLFDLKIDNQNSIWCILITTCSIGKNTYLENTYRRYFYFVGTNNKQSVKILILENLSQKVMEPTKKKDKKKRKKTQRHDLNLNGLPKEPGTRVLTFFSEKLCARADT